MTQTQYEMDARRTLKECGGRINIQESDTKTAPWDESGEFRHHYRVTLRGPGGSYTFDFWGSIHDAAMGNRASAYDVLACLEWNLPESFEDFCSEFGYDTDSRKAEATFKAVDKQARALNRIFPQREHRDKLAEIR